MVVRTQTRLLFASALAVWASGCLTPQTDAVTGVIKATAATVAANNSGGDIYLAVETSWEQTSEVFERHGICQVDTGSAVRQKTCTIRVPEGQLFYSNTKFVFGTGNPTSCRRISFLPAIYQISNAAVTRPALYPGLTVDCSAATLLDIPGLPGFPVGNTLCFSGPGKALYASWPSPMGKYFNTVVGANNEGFEKIVPANVLGKTTSVIIDGNFISNLMVANMIDNQAASVTSPGGLDVYLANTMHPYRARCLDQYEQVVAEVLVNVADQDLSTGEDPNIPADDQFYDFLQTL